MLTFSYDGSHLEFPIFFVIYNNRVKVIVFKVEETVVP
jgi:hypothetical protein